MGTLVYVEVTTNTKSSKKNDVLEQRMLRSCNSAQPKKKRASEQVNQKTSLNHQLP